MTSSVEERYHATDPADRGADVNRLATRLEVLRPLRQNAPMPSCPHPEGRIDVLFPATDYVTGKRFDVRRCRGCGLTLTWPQPPPDQLPAYYPPEYYGSSGDRRFPRVVEAGQGLLYRWRARNVERLAATRAGRVLDIGCGRGVLLSAFRRRGWSVEGTEVSERAARHAREILSLPVHVGPLEALALPADRFDAVVIWHVLEHVSDPSALLAEVNRILRPGGVLLVSVPNFGSPEARATRDGWFHLDVPRHLIHFTPAALRGALCEAGFSELRASWFAPEYDVLSIVQSTLNWIGLRPNLLYELLRRRGAKLLDGETAPWWQLALTPLLTLPLGILGGVLSLIAGLLGQGATLSVYARKSPR